MSKCSVYKLKKMNLGMPTISIKKREERSESRRRRIIIPFRDNNRLDSKRALLNFIPNADRSTYFTSYRFSCNHVSDNITTLVVFIYFVLFHSIFSRFFSAFYNISWTAHCLMYNSGMNHAVLQIWEQNWEKRIEYAV